MKDIVAYRMLRARKLKLLSQQEVAEHIGVSKQMISKYEKGLSIPDSSKLIQLANLFQQKVDYFFRPSKIELGRINFRKKSNFSKKRQDALEEWIKIKLENYLWIEERIGIDTSFQNVLQGQVIQTPKDITQAVLKLRQYWNIGLDPIHNIIQMLEDHAIKIIEVEEFDHKFDGLACLVNDKHPVIVVNGSFTLERKRFTLLHELGHLLLSLEDYDSKQEEKYCNQFASEFLLPPSLLIQEFGQKRHKVSFPELVAIQKKYGLSIPAIHYALAEAKIITKEQQTRFYRQQNSNPSLKEAIFASRFETPELSERYEQLVYRALSEECISISKASALLNLSIQTIREQLRTL